MANGSPIRDIDTQLNELIQGSLAAPTVSTLDELVSQLDPQQAQIDAEKLAQQQATDEQLLTQREPASQATADILAGLAKGAPSLAAFASVSESIAANRSNKIADLVKARRAGRAEGRQEQQLRTRTISALGGLAQTAAQLKRSSDLTDIQAQRLAVTAKRYADLTDIELKRLGLEEEKIAELRRITKTEEAKSEGEKALEEQKIVEEEDRQKKSLRISQARKKLAPVGLDESTREMSEFEQPRLDLYDQIKKDIDPKEAGRMVRFEYLSRLRQLNTAMDVVEDGRRQDAYDVDPKPFIETMRGVVQAELDTGRKALSGTELAGILSDVAANGAPSDDVQVAILKRVDDVLETSGDEKAREKFEAATRKTIQGLTAPSEEAGFSLDGIQNNLSQPPEEVPVDILGREQGSQIAPVVAPENNPDETLGKIGTVDKFDTLITNIAKEEGLSPNILKAIATHESSLNPKAVSESGAQGLMQLMPATARELGVTNPLDPEQNLRAGARYFKKQLDKFGSVAMAYAAFQSGPGRTSSLGSGIFADEERTDLRTGVTKILDYISTAKGGATLQELADAAGISIDELINTYLGGKRT